MPRLTTLTGIAASVAYIAIMYNINKDSDKKAATAAEAFCARPTPEAYRKLTGRAQGYVGQPWCSSPKP